MWVSGRSILQPLVLMRWNEWIGVDASWLSDACAQPHPTCVCTRLMQALVWLYEQPSKCVFTKEVGKSVSPIFFWCLPMSMWKVSFFVSLIEALIFWGISCGSHNLGFSPILLHGKFWWSSIVIIVLLSTYQRHSICNVGLLCLCHFIWLSHSRSMNAYTIQVILHQPRRPYLLNGIFSESLSTHLPPQTLRIQWLILMECQPRCQRGTTCGHSILLRQATHSVCLPVLFLTSSGALTKHMRQPV